MTDPRTARIAALNDRLRQTGQGGRTLITRGISARGDAFVAEALSAVRAFEAFDAANDPYGEHDFAALDVGGARIFFKIDYYALDHGTLSPDPADEAVCRRVLTIMLVDEY